MPNARDKKTSPRPLAVVAAGLAAVGAAWALSPDFALPFADRPGRLAPYSLPRHAGVAPEVEIGVLRARIRENPDGFLDLAALASVYIREAQRTGDASGYLLAEQAASRSLARMPAPNPAARLALAQIALARHDFAGALRLVEPLEDGDRGALSLKASTYMAQGRLGEARRAAERLAAAEPSLGSLSQLALVAAAEGRDAEAFGLFRRAIAHEQVGEAEASALARAWMGRLHADRGELDAAADLSREAGRIAPAHPVVLALAGELAMKRGDFRAASARYAAAYAAGRSPAHLVGQAAAEAARGQAEQAERLLAVAEARLRQDLAAGDFGHRRDLARLLLARRTPAADREARALMEAEVARRQDGETLALLAWSLGREGRWAEADAAIRRALAPGAEKAEWLHLAAAVAAAAGDDARAAELAREAHARDPHGPGGASFFSLPSKGSPS